MNRQTNHFGFGGPTGRPSGIRPPSTFGAAAQSGRPRLNSNASSTSIPSTASSRKVNNRKVNNSNLFNLFGSGGSRTSNAGGNTRQSIFGNFRGNPLASARKSVTGKLNIFGFTPQHNRPSFQANTGSSIQSSNRRSSVGGRGHLKDTRNLSDAAYQRQCLDKLILFLTTHGYQHPISKSLSTLRPTNKDISSIYEFLLVSGFGLKTNIMPMEIEIPKAMAALGYPFPVKKSDLQTFTTGRAVGSVFGMFEWLVDSLNYGLNMDPIRTFRHNFEGEVDIKSELINICMNSFAQELDQEQAEAESQRQLQELIVKKYGTENEFEQLLAQQDELEEHLNQMDQQIHDIKNLPKELGKFEEDIRSYDSYLETMRAHYRDNEQTMDNLQKEETDKLAAIKKLDEQRRKIKCIIEEQEFGIEEAVLARERKQQIEDEIKEECRITDEIKKSIRQQRLDLNKLEDTLRKMHSDMDSFITAIRDLVDSPVMSNYSSPLKKLLSHSDWSRILDGLKNINGETGGTKIIELNELFSHRVHELKIAIVQQLSSLQGSVALAEQQKLNECELMIEEKEKQLKNNEKQISQLMSEMEAKRKEQVSQIAAHQSDCDRTRQLLNEFEGNNKRSLKEEKQNLLDLRKQVEEKELQYRSEKSQKLKELEESVSSHRTGLSAFGESLANCLAREQTLNARLKAIAAKTGSTAKASVADKENTTKQKRDKKDKKQE